MNDSLSESLRRIEEQDAALEERAAAFEELASLSAIMVKIAVIRADLDTETIKTILMVAADLNPVVEILKGDA